MAKSFLRLLTWNLGDGCCCCKGDWCLTSCGWMGRGGPAWRTPVPLKKIPVKKKSIDIIYRTTNNHTSFWDAVSGSASMSKAVTGYGSASKWNAGSCGGSRVNRAGSPSSHEGSPWRRGGSVGKRWISITLMRIRLLLKMKAGSGTNQNNRISL